MKLEDLFVGYNDGKNEALYRENFEAYYFDYNGIYGKILQKDKFLLLGKKGTGKTILGEYIKKVARSQAEWFCELCSCRNLKFESLFTLKTKSLKPNEYAAIWEWLLLVKLAKFMLSQQDVLITNYKHVEVEKLTRFFNGCFMNVKLDMNRIIEFTKSKKVSAGFMSKFLDLNKDKCEETKEGVCTYLDYLYDLKETIFSAMSASNSTYTIILDELDDKFRNDELYKSNIISLIKTANQLNTDFLNADIKVKFIIMLRNDIFYVLNDSDLNKIEQDNSVKIDWGNAIDDNSPLVNMILVKLQQSVNLLNGKRNLDVTTIKKRLFSERVQKQVSGKTKSYSVLEFILCRSFLRPRDVITYLRLIIEKNPKANSFSAALVKKAEREYSEYLIKEVKNEMHGHVDEKMIEESLMLLRQYKQKNFSYNDIKEYYEKNRQLYSHVNIEKSLQLLFDFGVIGNFWTDRGNKYYSWAYRENATIDFNKCFNIHMGLRKALNIS